MFYLMALTLLTFGMCKGLVIKFQFVMFIQLYNILKLCLHLLILQHELVSNEGSIQYNTSD